MDNLRRTAQNDVEEARVTVPMNAPGDSPGKDKRTNGDGVITERTKLLERDGSGKLKVLGLQVSGELIAISMGTQAFPDTTKIREA